MPKPKCLLFDIGNVLVELNGRPIQAQWLKQKLSLEENWRAWIESPIAIAFETGEIGQQEFGEAIVNQLQLNISSQEFLSHFKVWPHRVYPQVFETLEALRENYTLAIFSNTNGLHWPYLMGDLELQGKFDYYFASHLIGMAKPQPAAFTKVLEWMNVEAQDVLFLDDNQANIDAASQLGLQTELVLGFEQAIQVLQAREIL